ncbi:MAG: phosphoglycerate kinase [Alphaproteobacteria bacterium]
MITLRNLDQLLKENLKDKIIFVRVDLNIPVKDNLILDDTRIERIIPTIKELKKHGCKICLLSHFGRPDGKNNEKFSLKQVIPSLEKHLREKIIFSESFYGDNIKTILNNAPSKSIILFETKLKVLENLTEKLDILFVGGGMANTFLLAQGFKIGKSLCEKSMLDIALNILEAAKNKNCKIILPEDALIAKNMEKGTPFDEVTIDKVPDDGLILDIGSKTIRSMNEYLNNVNSVVWCGPLGLFEVNPFQTGTVAIAKEISNLTKKNKLVSIAGGGDTVAALSQSNYDKDFTYISTAGGAFLELLAGEELPGIEVLKT